MEIKARERKAPKRPAYCWCRSLVLHRAMLRLPLPRIPPQLAEQMMQLEGRSIQYLRYRLRKLPPAFEGREITPVQTYSCMPFRRICCVASQIVASVVETAAMNSDAVHFPELRKRKAAAGHSEASQNQPASFVRGSTPTTILSAHVCQLIVKSEQSASSRLDPEQADRQEMCLVLHVDARRRDTMRDAKGLRAKQKQRFETERLKAMQNADESENTREYTDTSSLVDFDPGCSQVLVLRFHSKQPTQAPPSAAISSADLARKQGAMHSELAEVQEVPSVVTQEINHEVRGAGEPDTPDQCMVDTFIPLHTSLLSRMKEPQDVPPAERIGLEFSEGRRSGGWGPDLVPDDVTESAGALLKEAKHVIADADPGASTDSLDFLAIKACLQAQPYGLKGWKTSDSMIEKDMPDDTVETPWMGNPSCEDALEWPVGLDTKDVRMSLRAGRAPPTLGSEAACASRMQLSLAGLASPRLEHSAMALPGLEAPFHALPGPFGDDDIVIAALLADGMPQVSRAQLQDGRVAVAFISSPSIMLHRSTREQQLHLCEFVEKQRQQQRTAAQLASADQRSTGMDTEIPANVPNKETSSTPEHRNDSMTTDGLGAKSNKREIVDGTELASGSVEDISHEPMVFIWYVLWAHCTIIANKGDVSRPLVLPLVACSRCSDAVWRSVIDGHPTQANPPVPTAPRRPFPCGTRGRIKCFVLDACYMDLSGVSSLALGSNGTLVVAHLSNQVNVWHLGSALRTPIPEWLPAESTAAATGKQQQHTIPNTTDTAGGIHVYMMAHDVFLLPSSPAQTMFQHADWVRSLAIDDRDSESTRDTSGMLRIFTAGWEKVIRQFAWYETGEGPASGSTSTRDETKGLGKRNSRRPASVAPEAGMELLHSPQIDLEVQGDNRATEGRDDRGQRPSTSCTTTDADSTHITDAKKTQIILRLAQTYRGTSHTLAILPFIDMITVTIQFCAFPLSGEWPWSDVVEPAHEALPLLAVQFDASLHAYMILYIGCILLLCLAAAAVVKRDWLWSSRGQRYVSLFRSLLRSGARLAVWLVCSTLMVPILRVLFGAFDCTGQSDVLVWDRDTTGGTVCFRNGLHWASFVLSLLLVPFYVAAAWRLSHVNYDVREWSAAPGPPWWRISWWQRHSVLYFRHALRCRCFRSAETTPNKAMDRPSTTEWIGIFTRTSRGARLLTYSIPIKVGLVLVQVTLTGSEVALATAYVAITSCSFIMSALGREFYKLAVQRMVRIL